MRKKIFVMLGDEYEVRGYDPSTPCHRSVIDCGRPVQGESLVLLQQLKDEDVRGDFSIYLGNGNWDAACLLGEERMTLRVEVGVERFDGRIVEEINRLLAEFLDDATRKRLGIRWLGVNLD